MIAERNGLEVQELVQLNADRGMECTALVPGLELCVDVDGAWGNPAGCCCCRCCCLSLPHVRSQTLLHTPVCPSLPSRLPVALRACSSFPILRTSPMSAALPGGSNGCSPTYRLALADTCSSVAAAFNTTTARLQELNPGLDCMGLVPGQPLCMGTSGEQEGRAGGVRDALGRLPRT